MNAIRLFYRALCLDLHRWRNHRARARHVVYTWPRSDARDWQGEFERGLR